MMWVVLWEGTGLQYLGLAFLLTGERLLDWF